MKVNIPSMGKEHERLTEKDFDNYKIPAPPCNYHSDKKALVMLFNDAAEAIKYALHLGDVCNRMSGKPEYTCAVQKMRLVISCVNEQADFTSLEFPE